MFYPSNFDNLIVLGFLYFRDEIYEKAIKYFELACKVQPSAFIAEIQYGKCYQKLGNTKEALRVFRRIHNKYPENREALTYLIAVCRELNLPYDDYYQKMNKFDRDSMLSDSNMEYGQPIEFGGRPYGAASSSNYKGEEVNFSQYSKQSTGNVTQNQTKNSSFMKFQTSADDLLP